MRAKAKGGETMELTELVPEMQSLLRDRRLLGVFYARTELKVQRYLVVDKDPGPLKDLAEWLYAMYVKFEEGPVPIPESVDAGWIYDLRNAVMILCTKLNLRQLSDEPITPLEALAFFLWEDDDQAVIEGARKKVQSLVDEG